MDSRRRRLVGALGSAFSLSGLNGCSLFRPDPAELCARPSADGSALLIDIHAHVFNGSDIQIRDFISHLDGRYLDGVWGQVLEHLGGLLQMVTWSNAPSGNTELEQLRGLQCGDLRGNLRSLRASSYATAISTLDDAARKFQALGLAKPGRNFSFTASAQNTLEELKKMPYEQYERQRMQRAFEGPSQLEVLKKTIFTLYDFVVQHFQYRFANVLEYFEKYEAGGQRPVDLLVTSFLDFDHWISGGMPTPTTIGEQIEVMERISILSGGRVHSFVPYCPLRELETGESLKWVKDAIESRGFIGVKIYPPMGFAPYGNAAAVQQKKTLWQKEWLPARAKTDGFGKELDATLAVFYKWCIENNIPIMAHTSQTNIMHEDFRDLPGASYWKHALSQKELRSLPINFGHIGGNVENKGAPRGRDFVQLMEPAGNAFADIGYFFDVVDHRDTLEDSLLQLYRMDRLTRDRFMYGSDYQMIVSERLWGRYQRGFQDLIRKLAEKLGGGYEALEPRFFGINAMHYLGLQKSAPDRPNNRSRLEDFYKKHNIAKPGWMKKVDAIDARARR